MAKSGNICPKLGLRLHSALETAARAVSHPTKVPGATISRTTFDVKEQRPHHITFDVALLQGLSIFILYHGLLE